MNVSNMTIKLCEHSFLLESLLERNLKHDVTQCKRVRVCTFQRGMCAPVQRSNSMVILIEYYQNPGMN